MSYFTFVNALILRKLNKRRVFVQSFFLAVTVTFLFVLLVDPRQFSANIPTSSAFEIANQFEIANLSRNIVVSASEGRELSGYTGYTVQRLGLKPIPVPPLEPNNKESVINDVLSFHYPIDINAQRNFKCLYWADQSLNASGSIDQTLLIVVISAAGHSAKRNLIRKTWAGQSLLNVDWIQLIFLVGSTPGEEAVLKDRLEKENAQHQDLVQVNVIDTYANLTLKSVALLHWADGHCPGAKLVLKCDDDTYLNLNVLVNLLGKEQFQQTDRLYGLGIVQDHPQRDPSIRYECPLLNITDFANCSLLDNKYYISRTIWPWNMYPAFLSGGGYLMGESFLRNVQ